MSEVAARHGLTITTIVPPDSLDAADAGPFVEMVRIANAACRHDAGHDYLDQQPEEVLGFWHDTTDWQHIGFAAWREGRMIGAATLMLSAEARSSTLEFDIIIDPARWGEGAEDALLGEVERVASERGRPTIQTWTLHRPRTDGPRIVPSTGSGGVPQDDRQARFQREHGFSLEQVERNSAFDLHGPVDPVQRMLAEALEVAGDAYRLVTWTGPPTPDQWLDGFAYAISRMSTDAPQGGLVVEEQHWDADRMRRRDARLAAQGLTVSLAGVEDVATGALVAFNELVIGETRDGATSQYGTLVLKEHRGHRLGAIVKCANLLRWRDLVPESPRVSTFNAEENRPMLDINEAIGFVAVSYAGAWKKVLT